jgi:hypothetical protein
MSLLLSSMTTDEGGERRAAGETIGEGVSEELLRVGLIMGEDTEKERTGDSPGRGVGDIGRGGTGGPRPAELAGSIMLPNT